MAEGRYSTTARTVLGEGSTGAGWWVDGGGGVRGERTLRVHDPVLWTEVKTKEILLVFIAINDR